MAPKEHVALSDFIKKIHENLRIECNLLGAEKAWENHCTNKTNLKEYASAMKTLATQFWENSTEISRILWTFNMCIDYMNKEILKFRKREVEIAAKINVEIPIGSPNPSNRETFELLDVGSCYNPFQSFDCFNVTAVDIAPGTEDVIECDFLKVEVRNEACLDGNRLTGLCQESFDFVVFSLLLEYLPSPDQRKFCCEKAYKLLKSEGLLIIITPDSNHVGHNAKLMKSWQFVLAQMGFSRIKYEKLKHVHCMAFRKALNIKITMRWADLHKDKQVYDTIVIPQDFNPKYKNSLDHKKINTENYSTNNESNFFEDENHEKINTETHSTNNESNFFDEELPFCVHPH